MRFVLLVAGLVLAALNLRPALAGISPLLDEIMTDVGLTPAGGGAITTVMVVCLGVCGVATPVLARRLGVDRTLLFGLLLLAAGVVVRSLDGPVLLYGGAAVAGTAIAIMNVVMPAVVKQHFPDRVGLFTSVYVSALVLGAAIASGLAIPMERWTGLDWRGVSALAAVPALLGALLWLPQALRRRPDPQVATRPFRAILRNRTTWYITAFMGVQSLTFYVTLAWLPTIFLESGVTPEHAGYLLSLSALAQVVGTFGAPMHAGGRASQVPHVLGATALTATGYLGVLLAPTTLPWLWMIVLGIGQGATLALALLIITNRGSDPTSVTALSAVAQSVGYVLAAIGPVLVGALRESSGAWTVPLLTGLVFCGVQAVVGWLAARA
ncbi:CynX/NimT family MFS transporter [Nonomuraea sp. NPDC050663]|uniref:CynX/NimT family MFS transporter n=1 Tax=Nonomuraea sp. NPDC050663 TaxID=3364370 RepID=UPI0037BB967A